VPGDRGRPRWTAEPTSWSPRATDDLTLSVKEVPLKPGAARTRTCVGCRTARPQDELVRLVRTPNGVRFDPRRRLPGRGAYLCPHRTCLDAATRRGSTGLRRALRGASEAELDAALAALRSQIGRRHQGVHHQVPQGTVRSESA